MTSFTQYLISQNISLETVTLLLMLPLCATLIAFARQVIGIKGFGIYTPLTLAFAFIVIGLKYGLFLFLVILLTSTLTRLGIKRLRMLYLPRIAIVLTVATLIVSFILLKGVYLEWKQTASLPILAVLVMIILVEKFITAQIERSRKEAFALTAETVFLSVACYFLVNWDFLVQMALHYPFIVLVAVILFNIFLGKWTGLRLSEYFRFKEVIKHLEPPQKK